LVLNIPGKTVAQQDATTQGTVLPGYATPCYRALNAFTGPGLPYFRRLLNLDLGETQAVAEAGLGSRQLGQVLDGDNHILRGYRLRKGHGQVR